MNRSTAVTTLTPDDRDFPHGTPHGAAMGCKSAHCPAALPCRDVAQRYRGDFAFRRQIDAGMNVAEILETERTATAKTEHQRRDAAGSERAAAADQRRSEREAARAAAAAEVAAERARVREAAAAERAHAKQTERAAARAERELATSARRDEALAARAAATQERQLERETSAAARAELKEAERAAAQAERELSAAQRIQAREAERAIARAERETAAVERMQAREAERAAARAEREHLVHVRSELTAARRAAVSAGRRFEAAQASGRGERIELLRAEAERKQAALEEAAGVVATIEGASIESVLERASGRTGRNVDTSHDGEVRELYGQGLIDREIADRLRISAERVMRIRHRLHLDRLRPDQRATKVRRKPPQKRAEVQGCGTNASWARGCGCTDCEEAHKAYHRDYTARRKANGGAGLRHGQIKHGTASGYSYGCHDRAKCPSTPTCADASLAAEAGRRRAAGKPERVLVDAGPVRERARELMAAGMTTKAIAAAAGVGHTAVGNLVYGKRGRELAQVLVSTSDRIMKVTAA
ncbi:MAG: hypothetical protein QM598_05700 [Protaetiibacter sp.]